MGQADAARLLTTQFARTLQAPFSRALRDFRMVSAGDHIAVCISGGKDSMLLALLLQNWQRYSKNPFSLTFLAMDPGYTPAYRAHITQNAKMLGIELVFFETNILRVVTNHATEHPCFLCAKMRRGHLYAQAKALGCNKIALGHHYDDVVETTLMGLLYGGQVQAMLPRVQSKNYPGMELIRPLYYLKEEDIARWAQQAGLEFLPCGCPAAVRRENTKRAEIKSLIAELSLHNPQVKANIFHAVGSIDVEKVMGWRRGQGEKHSFLDKFDS